MTNKLAKKRPNQWVFFIENQSVRMIGIEPTWVTPLDPKSSASASFATSAYLFGSGGKSRGFT